LNDVTSKWLLSSFVVSHTATLYNSIEHCGSVITEAKLRRSEILVESD